MSDYCRHCSKKLDYTGEFLECRHCGYRTTPTAGPPMTQPEVRELVAEVRRRPPFSPKCRGRLHRSCAMSGCGCWCHSPEARQRYAAHLRREAAQLEHDNAPDAVERAEELRRRADEVTPLADEASHRCAYHECDETIGPGRVYCEGHR